MKHWKITWRGTLVIFLCASAILSFLAYGQTVQWSGRAQHRILVKILPHDLKGRALDRMPALVKIDQPLDPASIEIVRYDPQTGDAVPKHVGFRFDSGINTLFMSHYWPDDGAHGGMLIWTHEQHSNESAYYAIYYDAWHAGVGVAPRSWIGDGDIKYLPHAPFPQVLMVRPFGFDWDADGKTDVITGDELGYVTLYRNRGTAAAPKFGLGEPLQADGKLVKVEWCAAPVIADWNGDGLPDLLVAQEPQGVIRYYQNVGTRQKPVLKDQGLIQADDAVLKPPYLPVPEMPSGIFGDKYGSIPTVVDWNGNGKLSLLVGTYITGEVYLYRNIGTNADGTPKLHFEGPLQTDGKDLDVIWNSTPSAADLNNDGKLELVSGSFGMSATGGDRPQDSRLHFYERYGTALHEVRFPFDQDESVVLQKLVSSGGAPFSTALADMNSDGLIDLLVGTGSGTVVYFQNTGSRTNPRFHMLGNFDGDWVPHRWNFDSIVDFHGDGKPVLLQGIEGTRATISSGPEFNTWTELKTAAGKSFGKAATHGDDFGNAQLYDFDGDGEPDLIFGTVDGGVLIYRNIGTRQQPRFADAEPARMSDGSPLVAGFSIDSKVADFTTLQGNRAIPAVADLNGDGRTDLVVGDTSGEVLYYENVGDNAHPQFARPKKLLTRPGRIFLTVADWNGDNLPDLIVACSGDSSGKQIVLLRHVADRTKAEFETPINLPTQSEIPYPVPAAFDWDGDGDKDLLVASSYGYVYFLDGSFIAHGYAEAQVIGAGDSADAKGK
jgi:hypothetical protein